MGTKFKDMKKHELLEKKLSPMAAVDLLTPNFYKTVEDPDFFNLKAILIKKLDITFVKLIQTVSDKIDIPVAKIMEDTKKREQVYARMICMVLARLFTKHSTTTIGRELAGRDHATVLHATKTIINLYDTDIKIARQIDFLIANLNLKTGSRKSLDYLRK